jgi:AraC-like DNA-binding protein
MAAARAQSSAIAQAQTYLKAHYTESISIETLAQQVGLSPYYLIRSFRQQVGLPPQLSAPLAAGAGQAIAPYRSVDC